MDGSLAAIFMEGGGLPALPSSWNQPGESTEELKHLLMCASMELESAQASAKAQGKLHEARVRHLEELLKTTRKERDEAREECLKLQERLAGCSTGGGLCDAVVSLPGKHGSPIRRPLAADSRLVERDSLSCSYMQSSMASSSSAALQVVDCVSSFSESSRAHLSNVQWRFKDFQELEQQLDLQQQHLDMQTKHQQSSPTVHMEMQMDMDQSQQQHRQRSELHVSEFHQHLHFSQGNEAHGLQAHLSLECREDHMALEGSHQFVDMEVLDVDLPEPTVDLPRSLEQDNLLQHLQDEQELQSSWEANLSDAGLEQALARQSSFSSMGSPAQIQLPAGICSPPLSGSAPSQMPGMCSPNTIPGAMSNQMFQPCIQSGSAVASVLAPLERFGDSPPRPLFPPRQMHLPEPPEADPQVMLKSLPEKGKLLQAVMQAGPLLQTLLLAGPLPQWRHPPPALDTVDIPRVSMSPNSVLLPPPLLRQTSLPAYMPNQGQSSPMTMSPHVSRHSSPYQAGISRTESPILNGSTNLCSSSRLLRSASLHGQMMSRDMRLAGAYASIH